MSRLLVVTLPGRAWKEYLQASLIESMEPSSESGAILEEVRKSEEVVEYFMI